MTEQMVDVPNEGDLNLGTGDTPPEASPAENKELDDTQTDEGEDINTHIDAGEGNPEDDKLPFHKHPRWLERETEWQTRFNDQESRHQEDIKKLREEFGSAKGGENTEIPSWFGGSEAQWQDFLKFQDQRLAGVQKNTLSQIEEAKQAEDKAIKEATDFMQSEIQAIEQDKNLNPDGKKIDANKLLKIVIDNDLVDSKGRWNYKAGMAFYKQSAKPAPSTEDRKKIAAANTSETKGEAKPQAFKTSEDFKTDRPW